MRCKWCNKEYKKLAKSHIIPKAFAIPDGKNDRFIVTANSHKKKRPIGSWDDTILCQQCEKQYQYIDNNAAQILLKNFDKLIIPFNDRSCYPLSKPRHILVVGVIDYRKGVKIYPSIEKRIKKGYNRTNGIIINGFI